MTGPLLNVSDMGVRLGGRAIVDGVTLSLAPGEVALLVGHNGSGKSTLLKGIAGLLPIAAGEVRRDGHDCAVLLQERNVFLSRTIGENIAIGATGRFRADRRRTTELRAAVSHYFPELATRYGERCEQLSGGLRQLAALSRVALQKRAINLLDEPSVGLAEAAAVQALHVVLRAVRANGGCAILVEHNYRRALGAVDRLMIMKAGKLVYDGSPALIDDKGRFRDLYF